MRIAIIGAGYTGLAAAREWTALGHEIVATTIDPEQIAPLHAAGARAVLARGSDRDAMADVLAGQEAVVVMVAGKYALGAQPDLDDWRDTYLGTARTIVDLVAQTPSIRAVIVMSSTNAYGSAGGASVCDESTPATATKPQEQIQIDADTTYLALAERGVTVCVLRVGHIYGPGPRAIIPSIQRTSGRTIPYPYDSAVSLIHVDDLVGASLHLIDHGDSGIYNLVDDTNESRGGFYNRLATALGVPVSTWAPNGGLPTAFPNAKLKATGYTFRHPTFSEAVTPTAAS